MRKDSINSLFYVYFMWIKFLDYFGNFYNEVGWLIFWLKKKKRSRLLYGIIYKRLFSELE